MKKINKLIEEIKNCYPSREISDEIYDELVDYEDFVVGIAYSFMGSGKIAEEKVSGIKEAGEHLEEKITSIPDGQRELARSYKKKIDDLVIELEKLG